MIEQIWNARHGDARKADRFNRGFTLVEVVVAVAIIVVLLAVAFVAVWQYQRGLVQTEVDGVAREIYVAAQNHLSLAAEQGLAASSKDDAFLGNKESGSDDDDVRYLIYSKNGSSGDCGPNTYNESLLRYMLPLAAIDNGVRAAGNYVIRYQPSTGKVLDVVYAKPDGFFKQDFTDDDYARLANPDKHADAYIDYDEDTEQTKNDKAEKRRHYNGGNGVIGYYGGEDLGYTLALKAPEITVENGDTLKVTIEESNWSYNQGEVDKYNTKQKLEGSGKASLVMNLIVEGQTSKATMSFDIDSGADAKIPILLDDVTTYNPSDAEGKSAGHFANVVKNRAAEGGVSKGGSAESPIDFIPGEDLRIYARVTASKALSNVARSADITCNSLFAHGGAPKNEDGLPAEVVPTTYEIGVTSIRHLANLSKSISGFDITAFHNTDLGPRRADYSKVSVKQEDDLVWAAPTGSENLKKSFQKSFADTSPQGGANGNANGEKTKVFDLSGTAYDDGSFMPVTPGYALTYDGGNHWISGIKVSDASEAVTTKLTSAGLFGTLEAGSKVSNLELVDTVVNASGADASVGTLAGTVGNGSEITFVLARQDLSTNGLASVNGTGAAGGLVGAITGAEGDAGASKVLGCAAAVYVQGGTAGGLVGSSTGNVSILDSYAGGHTNGEGKYGTETEGTEMKNRINVIASGASGGLVGSAAGTVQHCYATASVSGNPAGGLVGANNASVSNSYATGQVSGAGAKGTFVGSGAVGSDNRRLETMNPGMDASGSGAESGAAGDIYPALEVYKQYLNSEHGAIPYDEYLARTYGGKYVMQTIEELHAMDDDAKKAYFGVDDVNKIPSYLGIHVGDWGMAETQVQNTK